MQIIGNEKTYISTQVLQELCNLAYKKLRIDAVKANLIIEECSSNNFLYTNSSNTILLACKVKQRYSFSFYDSLIIAAAPECGCTMLYSEDMQHGQVIENKLLIKNPFLL
jgi:predicted nucleic acid-binding protein